MNDIERAIGILKDRMKLSYKYYYAFTNEECKLAKVAISALEKQIPEKPYYLNYGGYNVGNWNHGIACICDYKAPYCRHCGQRLDWEVENE